MSDTPYTQFRQVQYRGPSTSDDYNARVEENYRDLMVLRNRARVTEEDIREEHGRFLKDDAELQRMLQSLERRVSALEAAENLLSFYDDAQIDNERFNDTSFSIIETDRCSVDTRHGFITLPKIDSSSLSKFSFVDNSGNTVIPSTLETSITNDESSADSSTATIDTSQPEFALIGGTGRIWQRNVVTNTANANGAVLDLYVKVPTDLFTTPYSNSLTVHSFPIMGTDILSVAVTSRPDPVMSDADGYDPINVNSFWLNNLDAVGWVAPGAWVGDAILDAGPKRFLFDPRVVTGIKIRLGQRTLYRENNSFVYSYGASLIDLGFDKYLKQGQTMVRFDVPNTISNVTNVQPQIYNVAEAEIPGVFSYQVVWETSYGSGIYTTSPVPFSRRVWVAVSLNATAANGSPALSGLTVNYTQ